MLEWIEALSPIFSAFIGVISYATLTNYRLDKLDEQIEPLRKEVAELDKRVTVLENK